MSTLPGEHGDEKGTLVAIRMRPLNEREISSGQRRIWRCLPAYSSITQTTPEGNPLPDAKGSSFFTYDRIFGENCSNDEVYSGVAKDLVAGAVSGVNGTIFAYGQTSSGKTFTMQGSGENLGGIVHMAAADMFRLISDMPTRDFLIRVSYLEIYNEEIRDLLNPETPKLNIREDPRKGVYVDAREEVVTDYGSILQAMMYGEKHRHVFATDMNARSSRSHTIVRIVVESKERFIEGLHASEDDVDDAVRIATLNLVDLAGSESVRHTGATGQRQKEGGKINQSLLSLSRVIQSLSQGGGAHVNYRDSKLTRILQPSLSGNASMAIVCCVTPAEGFQEETRSTLQFAQRAKMIKTHACVNEVLDERAQLKRLRRELAELKENAAEANSRQPSSDLQAEVERLHAERLKQAEKIEKLTALILTSKTAALCHDGEPIHVEVPLEAKDTARDGRRAKRARETWCAGEILASSRGSLRGRERKYRAGSLSGLSADLDAAKASIAAMKSVMLSMPADENAAPDGPSLAAMEELLKRVNSAETELSEFVEYADDIEKEKARLEEELRCKTESLVASEKAIESLRLAALKSSDIPSIIASFCVPSPDSASKVAACESDPVSLADRLLELEQVNAHMQSQLETLRAHSSAEISRLQMMLAEAPKDAHVSVPPKNGVDHDHASIASDPYHALALSDDDEDSSDEKSQASTVKDMERNGTNIVIRRNSAALAESQTIEELQNRLAEVERNLDNTLLDIQVKDNTIKNLESKLAAKSDEADGIADAKSMIGSLEKDVSSLVVELTASKAEVQAHSDCVSALRDALSTREEEMKRMQESEVSVTSALRAQLASAEGTLRDMEQQHFADVAQQAERAGHNEEVMRGIIEELRSQSSSEATISKATISEMQRLLDELRAEGLETRVALSELQEEVNQRRQQETDLLEQRLIIEEDQRSQIVELAAKLEQVTDESLRLSEALTKEKQDLQQSLATLMGENEESGANMQILQQDKLMLCEELTRMQSVLEESQRFRDELLLEKCGSEESLKSLAEERASLAAKISQLECHLHEIEKEKISAGADAEGRIGQLISERDAAVQEASDLATEVSTISSENESLRAKLLELQEAGASNDSAAESMIEQLTSERDAAVQEASNLAAENSTLSDDIQSLNNTISDLESAVDGLQKEKEELEGALQVIADQIAEMEKTKANAEELQEELTSALNESESLSREIIQLREQLDTKDAQHSAETSSEVASLRVKMEELSSKASESEETFKKEIERLHDDIEELEKSKAEAETRLHHVQDMVESLENEKMTNISSREELNRTMDEVRRENEALRDQVSQNDVLLEEQSTTLKGELDRVREELSSIQQEREKSNEKNGDLVQKLQEAETESFNIQSELKGTEKQLEQMESHNKILSDVVDQLRNVERELRGELHDLSEKLNLAQTKAPEENEKLLGEMAALMESKLAAESRASGMEMELSELRQSFLNAEQQAASEQKIVIEAAEENLARKTAEADELRASIQELEVELKGKADRIKKLEEVRLTKEQVEKLQKLKATSKRNESEKKQLQAEVTKLQERLKSIENDSATVARLSELESAKDTLSEKLRKYAQHCKNLEAERGSIKVALQQAGVDLEASDDLAEAVYTIVQGRSIVSSEDSSEEVSQLRRELREAKAECKKLQDELHEPSSQLNFYENENLQLLVEIKEMKKQAIQYRAEIEALTNKIQVQDTSLTPRKRSSPLQRAPMTRSAAKKSANKNISEGEKENAENMAESGVEGGRKSRARALTQQTTEDGMGGECSQS